MSFNSPQAGTGLGVDCCVGMDQIRTKVRKEVEFQEEFTILSTHRTFTLKFASLDARNEWMDAIHAAIGDFKEKLITFRVQEGACQ